MMLNDNSEINMMGADYGTIDTSNKPPSKFMMSIESLFSFGKTKKQVLKTLSPQ